LLFFDLHGPNARFYYERSQTGLCGEDMPFKFTCARIELDQPGPLSFYKLFVGVINLPCEQ
jgi:hypothetical protein